MSLLVHKTTRYIQYSSNFYKIYILVYQNLPSTFFFDFCGITCKQNLVVDELNLAEVGPKFEHHPLFPARTNTGQVLFTFMICYTIIKA